MLIPALIVVVLVALLAGVFALRFLRTGSKRDQGSSSTQLAPDSDVAVEGGATAIIIGEPEAPLITIAREAPASLATYGPPLPESQRLALAPLLQHAPLIAVNAANAGSNLYRVTFDPEIQKLIAQGKAQFMQAIGGGVRGAATDGSGSIVGQARLFAANSLRVANIAAASWQVLTVITAQSYLADIDRKLDAIQTSLDAIKQWLELEKVAVLTNSLSYVSSVRDACLRGEFTEHDTAVFAQQLEDAWVQCGAVAETFRLVLATYPERFEKIELTVWFSLDDAVAAANTRIAEYERLSRAHALACYTRTAIVEARAALPLRTATTAERLKELRAILSAQSDARDAFFDGVEQQVRKKMGASVVWASTNDAYRSQVLTEATAAQTRLQQLTSDVREAIANAQERVQVGRQNLPTTLLVELGSAGQVSSAYQPPAPTA